ncbi:hypothetical protein RYX36_037047 [Vicia faba]
MKTCLAQDPIQNHHRREFIAPPHKPPYGSPDPRITAVTSLNSPHPSRTTTDPRSQRADLKELRNRQPSGVVDPLANTGRSFRFALTHYSFHQEHRVPFYSACKFM